MFFAVSLMFMDKIPSHTFTYFIYFHLELIFKKNTVMFGFSLVESNNIKELKMCQFQQIKFDTVMFSLRRCLFNVHARCTFSAPRKSSGLINLCFAFILMMYHLTSRGKMRGW